MNVKNALQAIADREGVSIFEVRKEIQAAIDEGMKSTDKSVQTYWSKIPCKCLPRISIGLWRLIG